MFDICLTMLCNPLWNCMVNVRHVWKTDIFRGHSLIKPYTYLHINFFVCKIGSHIFYNFDCNHQNYVSITCSHQKSYISRIRFFIFLCFNDFFEDKISLEVVNLLLKKERNKQVTSRLLESSPPSEQVSKSAYYVNEAPMGKWSWCCMSTGQDGSKELNLEWIGPVRCCVVRNLENTDCVIMAPHCGWQNITNTVKPLI